MWDAPARYCISSLGCIQPPQAITYHSFTATTRLGPLPERGWDRVTGRFQKDS